MAAQTHTPLDCATYNTQHNNTSLAGLSFEPKQHPGMHKQSSLQLLQATKGTAASTLTQQALLNIRTHSQQVAPAFKCQQSSPPLPSCSLLCSLLLLPLQQRVHRQRPTPKALHQRQAPCHSRVDKKVVPHTLPVGEGGHVCRPPLPMHHRLSQQATRQRQRHRGRPKPQGQGQGQHTLQYQPVVVSCVSAAVVVAEGLVRGVCPALVHTVELSAVSGRQQQQSTSTT